MRTMNAIRIASSAVLKFFAWSSLQGKVTPKLSRIFPLAEASAAQQLVEEGHTEGKVVLIVA